MGIMSGPLNLPIILSAIHQAAHMALRVVQADVPWPLDEEHALRIYHAMVGLQTMDVIFYDSQRQARSLWAAVHRRGRAFIGPS